MISILITIALFAITISLLVFIHEGGHFLVAKWTGVWVHEFAIGFGPLLWQRKRSETEYSIRLLPLGGYVRMAGEDTEGNEEDAEVPPDRLFTAKSGFAKTAIIFAGPLMNLVAALILMIVYVGGFGVSYVEVGTVAVNSPAYGVLQSGDKLVSLAGQPIYSTAQLQKLVQASEGQPMSAVVERNGSQVATTLTPYRPSGSDRYLIGIYFAYALTKISALPSDTGLAQQGLQVGDDIAQVDGKPIGSGSAFLEAVKQASAAGKSLQVMVDRNGSSTALQIDPSKLHLEGVLEDAIFEQAQLPVSQPVVSWTSGGSIWANAGLQGGDRIVSANGQPIGGYPGLLNAVEMARHGSGDLNLSYERDGQTSSVLLDVSHLNPLSGLQALHLDQARRKPASLLSSVAIGAHQIWNVLVATYLGIKQVVTGQMSAGSAFVGPVGIADLLGRSLNLGFDYFLNLVAILSLMLGVFNLLPFPALDGSRIVFIGVNGLLKMIVGRPIPAEKEGWVHYIGFMLLMALVLLITWNDIQRLFHGGF